ncbi:MAG: mechanosensitive ion channel family protein [bacterium]
MDGVQGQLKKWSMVVFTFFESVLQKLGEYVPNLFGAIIIIIIGFIAAKILRGLTRKALRVFGITALGERVKFNLFLKKAGITKGLDDIMASLVYYMTLLIFLVSASEILGIKIVLDTLNTFITYLPHVLGAFIILVFTLFVAKFIKETCTSALSNLNIGYPGIVGSFFEILVIGFGILIALNELGFDMSIFTANITILVAGAVSSIALSVGLGSKSIMANILARYYINQLFTIGDEVLFAGHKGTIEKITPVSVLIKTEKGDELYIPNEMIIKAGSMRNQEGNQS